MLTLTGISLCSCSFWFLPFSLDLQPQRAVLFCPAERDLSCREDLGAHFTAPSVGPGGGSCGNAELRSAQDTSQMTPLGAQLEGFP